MTKTAHSYALSRHNATSWGTHVVGPRPCRGIEACRYRYCAEAGLPCSPPGTPCRIEQTYADSFAASFREQWSCVERSDSIDLEEIVTEATTLTLQRFRIASRSNAAWQLTDESGDLRTEAYHEMELTYRYAITLGNRWLALLRRLTSTVQEMSDRANRLHRKYYGFERPHPPIGARGTEPTRTQTRRAAG